ncbi:MAG: hypothetical protein IIC90_12440 [Chloroflexi bacterium]|nr:hypothetical protein [Chloroflexota bacterium]
MPFPLFALGMAVIAALTMVATTRLSRRQWAPIIVALAGALALLLFNGIVYQNFVLDDAFITLRYSRNLADGLGPNWNSSGRVEGYTSFLWMALLAGVAKLGFDLVVSVRVFGLLAVAATWVPVYKLWRLWSRETEGSGINSPVVFAAVVVGLAITGGVGLASSGGLETPLFMALITWSAYLYLLERRGGRIPWSALALAATAMTRPEGLIAAGVTGLFVLFDAATMPNRRQGIARAVSWGGVFLAIYGSYFLWRFTYYDYLLPNTFYAKVEPNSVLFSRGLEYVYDGGLRVLLLPMFVGAAILLTRPKLRHDAVYLIVLCGTMVTAVVFEGGDFIGHSRFLVPVLPLIFLGGLAGFALLLKNLAPRPAAAALIATVALGLGGLTLLQDAHDPNIAVVREGNRERQLLGTWLSEHTPENYTVGAFAVGAVAYYTERDVLDLLGMNDVVIAHTEIPRIGRGVPGHERYNIDYVFAERPEVIVVSDGEPLPVSEAALVGTKTFIPALNALYGDPRLLQTYQLRWLFLDGLWYSFLQRRDTVADLHGPGLAGDQNFLHSAGDADVGGWQTWRSALQPAPAGIMVSSSEINYSAFHSTADSELRPLQGQSYVALVWVKSTEDAPDGAIKIAIQEDGAREGETFNIFPLTSDWQPIWVDHVVTGPNVEMLDVTILRLGTAAKPDSFIFRDALLMAAE